MKAVPALILIVLVGLLGWALPARAEKALLTDTQLDEISAGKWDSIDFSGPGHGVMFHVYGPRLFGSVPPVPNVPLVAPVGSGKFGTPRGTPWFGAMLGVGLFGTPR